MHFARVKPYNRFLFIIQATGMTEGLNRAVSEGMWVCECV